jgi:dimethylaniline monooxygenase (N-oxide forming)
MDELARLVGCRPRLLRHFVHSPSLTSRLLFHGLVPYQFRLEGPQRWEGARHAIKDMERRMVENTRTRKLEGREKRKKDPNGLWKAVLAFLL